MNPMRAALLLTALMTVAFAGSAAASDYMLVPLLEGETGTTVQPNAPPAEPQSLPPPAAPGSSFALAGAIVAAAAVTVGGFWFASRRAGA